MNGILFETDEFIAKMINRGGVATVDIMGGAPVVQGGLNSTDSHLRDLTAYATAGTKVGIAYNPAIKYDIINGSKKPANSYADDRYYTNIAGDVVDYFFPVAGVGFGVIEDGIVGTPEVDKFLEPADGLFTWAVKDTQTADVPSFKIIGTQKNTNPTLTFVDEEVTIYLVETQFNG